MRKIKAFLKDTGVFILSCAAFCFLAFLTGLLLKVLWVVFKAGWNLL